MQSNSLSLSTSDRLHAPWTKGRANTILRRKYYERKYIENKVWQIIGVAVLCAVCVLTAVLGIVFGMNHSSEDLNVSKDMSDNDIVVNATEENGIMLTSGVATTAADGTKSKVLTATVTPSAASKLDYTWSVAFKNSNSTWAKAEP